MPNKPNQPPKPVVLIICDGFGIAPANEGNAITQARTPNFLKYVHQYPAMTLRASGSEVGLSWGEVGNSEVGHLTIGAGRVRFQSFPRITNAIEDGTFFENAALRHAMEHVRKTGGQLHLVGLVSPGRVHAMDAHCYALLEMAKKRKVKRVAVHAFLDGRDTVYNTASDFIFQLLKTMKKLKVGVLASISGRYYAMDRDQRWDRTQKTYDAIVKGEGPTTEDALKAIKDSYAKEVFDEQFVPTVLTEGGKPVATVEDGDALIFFNFRADRMRQLVQAFVLPRFAKFTRDKREVFVATMTEYEKDLPVEVAFPPEVVTHSLAETISDAGLTQLHIAETEKYAHITFFLNGTREEPFPGEKRVIIPSPSVASYDKAPRMSAEAIAQRVVKEVRAGSFDAIMINFANADMVGHTGDFAATIEAVECVDECLGLVADAVLEKGGVVLMTGDHGNAEEVRNVRTGDLDKEHSTNPVPLLIIGSAFEGKPGPSGEVPEGDLSLVPPVGMLADVAPTMLAILGIKPPKEMTGNTLL